MSRWQPWMVWDRETQAFTIDIDVFPSIRLEYDISSDETAHFYNLGADVGTERLMIGTALKIPSHNPKNREAGRNSSFIKSCKEIIF